MADLFDLDQHDEPVYSAEYVLEQVDDLLIYRYYLGAFKLGKPIKSPFRTDSTPSFSITLNHNWFRLMWKDFGTGECGDCFKLVAKLKNITYSAAIYRIACDFGLVKGCSIVTKKEMEEARAFKEEFKKEYLIQIDIRAYTEEELAYWGQFGITKEDLRDNDIFSIRAMWINKIKVPDSMELRFAYYFPNIDKWKIYTPMSTQFKWFGNVPINTIEGLYTLAIANKDKPIIVTKSRKDRIVLSKVFYNVISCQNESEVAIPKTLDNDLEIWYSGKKYCWFDSDEAGKIANRKLNARGYKWINVPNNLYTEHGLKDPSDVIKFFGVQAGQDVLIKELQKKGIL